MAADNYYAIARREWNERYGSYISSAKNWRIAALSAIAVALIAVAGVGYIGAQNKFVPYVVEVDKLGAAVAVAPAAKAQMPDGNVVKAELANMIANLRTVSSDVAVQKELILKAYELIPEGSAAFTTMNDYFAKHSPMELAQTETVQVEITSVLPLSDKSYQIDWTETARGTNTGALIATTHWRASVATQFSPPTDEAGILHNPLGLYVTNLQWAQQL